mmetsp:Transcript_18648/g.36546  ORF Transcript_18648/g.36546 Transcript_18648/m.36546 type:complete len:430 (+) Transcript_18648:129-1418(+)
MSDVGGGGLKPVRREAHVANVFAGEDVSTKRQKVDGNDQVPNLRTGGAKTLEEVEVDVLHKCEDIVVLDKPADFRLDGDFAVTVEKYVQKIIPEPEKRPRWIHQLDFATSGVLAVGLCRRGAGNTAKLFSQRLTKKYYVALVRGRLRPAFPKPGADGSRPLALARNEQPEVPVAAASAASTDIEDEVIHEDFRFATGKASLRIRERWERVDTFGLEEAKGGAETNKGSLLERLLREMYGPVSAEGFLPVYDVEGAIAEPDKDDFRMVIDNSNGRASRTQVVPVAYGHVDGEEVTKVVLRPISGRRHQLRLHTMHMGFPILGDATYGPVFCEATSTVDDAFYMVPARMYLHALRLDLNFAKNEGKVRYKDIKNFLGGKLQDLVLETKDPFPLNNKNKNNDNKSIRDDITHSQVQSDNAPEAKDATKPASS